MKTNDTDTLQIILSFKPRSFMEKIKRRLSGITFGEGTSSSPSCSLARPYLQLFKVGKPPGKINHMFFKGNKWPTSIFGSLTYTPGERILFFPGIKYRTISGTSNKDDTSQQITGVIDHITLEPNYRKWHLTIIGKDEIKKRVLPSINTTELNDGIIFWFGLSIRNQSVLETTPEELILNFPSPPTDSTRRMIEIQSARANSIHHIIHLNEQSGMIKDDEFLHFDFFVGPIDLDIEKLRCNVPSSEPIVRDFIERKIYHRAHPVSLEGVNEKIWINVSKHTGTLSDNAFITWSARV